MTDSSAQRPAAALIPTRHERGILSKRDSLRHLFTLPRFPVFMGCVTTPPEDDRFLDMSFSICRETGSIQLDLVPPLDLVYLTAHNDAVGGVWTRHHEELADFLGAYPVRHVLEIGGGGGRLWRTLRERRPDIRWTVVDPNPLVEETDGLQVIRDYFRPGLALAHPVDVVVHSHVLEHALDPEAFLADIASYLTPDGLQIFSYPNMLAQMQRHYTSCMNFEHTLFLTEPMADALLARQGFAILDKKTFGEAHSIFYATRWTGERSSRPLPNLHDAYSHLIDDFAEDHRQTIARINQRLAGFEGRVYLFGGHIFSQFLLAFGLDDRKLTGILDNSALKIGKRLYGTRLEVFHPDVIAGDDPVAVVLRVANYRQEVTDQLRRINPRVEILE